MSTVAAQELKEKFGFESIFSINTEKGEFDNQKLSFGNLIVTLTRNQRRGSFHYDYANYVSGDSYYEYTDRKKYTGRVRGNLKKGRVDLSNVSYKIQISYRNKDFKPINYEVKTDEDFTKIKSLKYTVYFPYLEPASESFEDKYALKVEFFEYEQFKFVYNTILRFRVEFAEAETQIFFTKLFARKNNGIDQLKWLYRTAPDFVLKYYRTDEDLMKDVAYFISHDIDLQPSDFYLPQQVRYVPTWFRDSSSAIIKALRGLYDPVYAYKYFKEKPQQAIRIYSGLEGVYKEEFTGFLSYLAKYFGSDDIKDENNEQGEKKERPVFHLGKDYTLDSELGQSSGKSINLKERKKVFDKIVKSDDPLNPGMKRSSPSFKDELISDNDYHPMELVILYNVDTGEVELVVASDVKRLSDQAEWEAVMQIVGVTISIAAVIASFGILSVGVGTAGVFATAFAYTDLIVEGVNILNFIRLGPDETDEFKEFWDKLSLFTGVVVIGSSFYRGLMKYGPRLLNKLEAIGSAATLKMKKALVEVFLTINLQFGVRGIGILDFKILIQNTTKVVGKSGVLDKQFTKLWDYGVLVVSSTKQSKGKKIFGLVYRGELLESGSIKRINAFLKEKIFVKGADDLDIINSLDKALKRTRLFKQSISSTDELISFLGKMDESVLATNLDDVGIKVLFRGTTRNNGRLYPGSLNSIENGFSTSTDPIKAAIFAIESSTEFGGKGVFQVFLTKDLKNINLQVPNWRFFKELEIVLNSDLQALSGYVIKEIPIEKVRGLMNRYLNLPESLPTRITFDSGDSGRLLRELPSTTLDNSYNFYLELLKL